MKSLLAGLPMPAQTRSVPLSLPATDMEPPRSPEPVHLACQWRLRSQPA